MKGDKRLLILGVLIVISTMVMATQFAVTQIAYEFAIVHPSNANIRYIGSDNASDGVRLLRIDGDNITKVGLKLYLGNYTAYQTTYFTAAFAIINEENFSVNISYINVSSTNWTYMKIWLHGDRDANANATWNDNSSVQMYDNGTVFYRNNSSAWVLAPGNRNPNDMCSNVSDRINHTILTPWDERAHVRYSLNNSDAASNISDFVWVQIGIQIDNVVDFMGVHSGWIYVHFEAQTKF